MRVTWRGLAAGAVLVSVPALAACGDDSGSSATTQAATSIAATTIAATTTAAGGAIAVASPWARTTPAAATTGAVYLTLTANDSDALVKASVDASVAKAAELHETTSGGAATTMAGGAATTMGGMSGAATTVGGMSGEMSMQPVAMIPLPAGQPVALKPGGYHIMLVDLAKPLQKGQTFSLTLTFEKAAPQVVTVEVRDTEP